MILLPFPTSPVLCKWTELQVTAIDTWQHPEVGIANSAMFHKANPTCLVSCNPPVLCSLLYFQEHNSYYQITTTTTVPLLQTAGN